MADWKKITALLLLEDGCIDSSETNILKSEILDDGIVDEEEMHFLIGLRKSLSEKCEQFEEFFFIAFESFLLADGEIDDYETELLRSVIFADGKVDQNEKQFLTKLKLKAKKVVPLFTQLCAECQI